MTMENSFSKNIKELRTSLKLTQSEFAKEIGTTQATLSSYENTDKLPSIDILMTIAHKYQVSLDWLCGLSSNKDATFSIVTYSDLINLFSSMSNLPNLDIKFSNSTQSDDDYSHHTVANFQINDQIIINFFSEWLDVLALCQKSPSGKKLYDIWIKDILERYNFPIKRNPSEIVDDLPLN